MAFKSSLFPSGRGTLGDGYSNVYPSATSSNTLNTASKTRTAIDPFVGGELWRWGQSPGSVHVATPFHDSANVGYETTWSHIEGGNGNHFVIGLKNDATLWSWGTNEYGELGRGLSMTPGSINRSSPTQIINGLNGSINDSWRQISCGYDHIFGLTTRGAPYSWGRNQYGQLGLNNVTNQNEPQLPMINISSSLRPMSGVDISAGAEHSHFIVQINITNSLNSSAGAPKGSKLLFAAGRNNVGQLGDNSTINRSSPRQIGSDTTWKMVSSGYDHTHAIKDNGSLWAWGSDYHGQSAVGSDVYRSSPAQVGSDTNWLLVSAGYKYTMAIKTDGTLWGWGLNDFGEIGDGREFIGPTGYNRISPVQIGTNNNWVSVQAGLSGSTVTSAIKSDGTAWMWGYNATKEIANPYVTGDVSSPVLITGMVDYKWKQLGTKGGPGFGRGLHGITLL
jgi:hypothetical protein